MNTDDIKKFKERIMSGIAHHLAQNHYFAPVFKKK